MPKYTIEISRTTREFAEIEIELDEEPEDWNKVLDAYIASTPEKGIDWGVSEVEYDIENDPIQVDDDDE